MVLPPSLPRQPPHLPPSLPCQPSSSLSPSPTNSDLTTIDLLLSLSFGSLSSHLRSPSSSSSSSAISVVLRSFRRKDVRSESGTAAIISTSFGARTRRYLRHTVDLMKYVVGEYGVWLDMGFCLGFRVEFRILLCDVMGGRSKMGCG